MGFKKGEPNPGIKFGHGQRAGRPKLDIPVTQLARERTTEAIETLTAIMRDRKATASARVSAAVAILERAWGKAPVSIDLHRHDDVRNLTDDELLVIIGTATDDGGAGVIEQAPDPSKLN